MKTKTNNKFAREKYADENVLNTNVDVKTRRIF